MGFWEATISLLPMLKRRRRMPISIEQYEPYKGLMAAFTELNKRFVFIKGTSPNINRETFQESYNQLNDAIAQFYTEFRKVRSILDEPQLGNLDGLVHEVIAYRGTIMPIESMNLEQERRIRHEWLNDVEDRIDRQFIEAEASMRKFFLGPSLKSWWHARKVKSR
jgi:hypothetical protein